MAIVGTVATLLAGAAVGRAFTDLLLPITAGGFVYIASASLIPELQHDRSVRALFVQVALMALGVAVMRMLKVLPHPLNVEYVKRVVDPRLPAD
jgi:zinc and cadmium transporter